MVLGAIIFKVLKERGESANIHYGFLFFTIILLVPAILLFGRFWKGEAFSLGVILGLFHFMSWYVFYTKRLKKFPKNGYRGGILRVPFYWRGNMRQFWSFVILLQTILLLLFIVYLSRSFSSVTNYLVSPSWVPFWAIVHATVSFLPKPVQGKFIFWNFPVSPSRFSNFVSRISFSKFTV